MRALQPWIMGIALALFFATMVDDVAAVTSPTFLQAATRGQGSVWPSLIPNTGDTFINGWWPALNTIDNVHAALADDTICMAFSGNDATTSSLPTIILCHTSQLSPSLSSVDDIITISFNTPSLDSGVWLVHLSLDNGITYGSSTASLTTYAAAVLSFSLTSPSIVRCTGGNALTFIVSGLSQAALTAASTDGAAIAIINGTDYTGAYTKVEFPVTITTITAGALMNGLLPDSLTSFIPSLSVMPTGSHAVTVSVWLSLNGITNHNTDKNLTIQPSRPLRVLYTFGGPIAGESWSKYQNLARLECASLWQGSVEAVIMDANGYDIGHITRLRAYLDTDNTIDVVMKTTSNLYSEIRQVALDYPHIKFLTLASPDIIYDATGSPEPVLLDNFGLGWVNSWEGKYLAGIVAGSLAARYNRSSIGYIGGFRIPQVVGNINAFTMGARSVAPNVIVHFRITNSWYYPYAERLATQLFIDEGNRIMHLDTSAPDPMIYMDVAGGFSIGANGGDESIESIVTATEYDWTKVHQPYLAAVFDGTLTNNSQFISGVSDTALFLRSYSRYVPTSVRNKITTTVASGAALSCLCGPIWDNTNTLVVAAGICPNSSVMGTMNWFARGVVDHGDYNPDPPAINPSYIQVTWLAIFFTVLGLALIAAVAACVWIVVSREQPAIRASSWKFCLCIALGCVLSLTSGFLFGIDERLASVHTLDGICATLPWVVTISFSVTFGCLFAKVWRVYMIFSATKLQTMALPDRLLALIVSLIATPAVVILIIWTCVSPLRWTTISLETDSDSFVRVSYSQCTSDHTQTFMILLYIYAGGLMLAGNLVSFFSRNVDSRFTESKMINMSMINMLQVFLILIPLNYAITNSPDALFVLRAFSVLLINIIVMASIFGPKLQHARPETMVVGGTRASIMSNGMSSPMSATGTFMVRSAFGSQIAASHASIQHSTVAGSGMSHINIGSSSNGDNSINNHSGGTLNRGLSSAHLNSGFGHGNNGNAVSPPSITSPGGGLGSPTSPYGHTKHLATSAALLHQHHQQSNSTDKHLHGSGSQSPVLLPGVRPPSGFNARRATSGGGAPGSSSPLQHSHSLGSHHSGTHGNGNGNGNGAASNGTSNGNCMNHNTIGTTPSPASPSSPLPNGHNNDNSGNGNGNIALTSLTSNTGGIALPPLSSSPQRESVTPIVG